uniref:Uncharacterized protein n=1 Tax=Arundo donax TaxID=35708 RepID=A0A0A9DZG4_ARUDO
MQEILSTFWRKPSEVHTQS